MFDTLSSWAQYFYRRTTSESEPSSVIGISNGLFVSVGTGEDRQSLNDGRSCILIALDRASRYFFPPSSIEPSQAQQLPQTQQVPQVPQVLQVLSEAEINEAVTELSHAARSGHLKRVQELSSLLTAEQINRPGTRGQTALMWAAHHGHSECLRALVGVLQSAEHICLANDLGHTAVLIAAGRGHAECVKALLGVVPSAEQINRPDAHGRTALMWAARYGHVECVRALLGGLPGADQINRPATNGQTALMWAAQDGHVECVRALLGALQHHRGSINAFAPNGTTALSLARQNGRFVIVGLLLDALKENGRAPEATDAVDHETISIAGQLRHFEVLFTWLSSGGSAQLVETFFAALGDGPLNQHEQKDVFLRAAELGHAGVFKRLLQRGADEYGKRNDGLGALELAVRQGHFSILDAWLARGHSVPHQLIIEAMRATGVYVETATTPLSIDSKDAMQANVLMKAISNDWTHLAQELISMKAQVLLAETI